MEVFDNKVKNYLSFLDNDYVSAGLSLFLILYAGMAAPKLPTYVAKLFDNVFVQLLMFFLIVYVSRKNPTVAIIAAVAVMVSLMTLNKIKFNQEMMSVVNGENGSKRRVNLNGCNCDCDSVEDVVVSGSSGSSESEESEPVGVEEGTHSYEELDHVEELPVVALHQESSSGVEETVHSSVEEHEHKVDQIMQIKSEQEEKLGRKMTDDELRSLCSAVANKGGCANGGCGAQGDLEGFNGRTSYASAF
jgi:hypothetical protein